MTRAALVDRLNAARSRATKGGLPVRRTDGALYDLLAEIKAICEDVARNGQEAELRQLYWERGLDGPGRKRYLEAGADAHVMVCRYVLDGEDTRNSTYRYAMALREAAKRQIAAADLADWLRKSGGVNALYKARETAFRVRHTKTLHLTSAVAVQTGKPVTLTLTRRPDGFFDVVTA